MAIQRSHFGFSRRSSPATCVRGGFPGILLFGTWYTSRALAFGLVPSFARRGIVIDIERVGRVRNVDDRKTKEQRLHVRFMSSRNKLKEDRSRENPSLSLIGQVDASSRGRQFCVNSLLVDSALGPPQQTSGDQLAIATTRLSAMSAMEGVPGDSPAPVDPLVYRDLLIFEESLRSQYLYLQRRRRKYLGRAPHRLK
jgi:hypothetical protein